MKLTADQREELGACAIDAAYFIHQYCWIDDAQNISGTGGGTMPFHLWPAQLPVLDAMVNERLVITLKARQLGISWLACGYDLQQSLFTPGFVTQIFSKDKDAAAEMVRRIQAMYDRLPEWMRQALPKQTKDNAGALAWANESRIESNAATQNAGHSDTASLVIWDEAARTIWDKEMYKGVKPIIDGGGKLMMISTANGIGNVFHNTWIRAEEGRGAFKPIFLPWWSRPGRDAAWYAAQMADADDPNDIKEQYPSTAEEAFLTSGNARFDATWIQAQSGNVRSGIPLRSLPSALAHIPGLTVYKLPEAGRRYVAGADVAEGKENGDECDMTLLDAVSWEEVANLNGKWEPDTYADYTDQVCAVYRAEILPERNNHGHAYILSLKKRLQKRKHLERLLRGDDEDYGHLTTRKSKPQMIDNLAVCLRDRLVTIHSQAALSQMRLYMTGPNGDTNAPSGYKDDRVISFAIALKAASRPRIVPRPAVGGSRPHVQGYQVR